ncbi:MAG: hypothetical protein AB2992_06565, partial [Candidatus Symbiodolus clandestinus]
TGQTEPSTANLMLFAAMWPKTITQPQRISLIQEALAQGADINAQDSSCISGKTVSKLVHLPTK